MKTSVLAISDVHVGCPRLDPRQLHERFRKFLYPKITPEIDILFICGDFFDTGLSLNSTAALESLRMIDELKILCKQADCDMRVLRGTFTHDRNQPRHFIYGEDPESSFIKLYEGLSVEFNKKTGMNILYVPDNLASNDIYADIRELLSNHNLEKVDIMVHHGYFKHMLPPNVPAPHGCLDQEIISKIVTGCTLNGHVHISSIFENCISIGSFDRLSYGEEAAKGFYKITYDSEAIHGITGETCPVWQFEFIRNDDANKFLTFDLRPYGGNGEMAIAEFTDKWNKLIHDFGENELVRIRFLAEDQGLVEACSQLAKSLYPSVQVDKAQVAKREQILENVHMELSELPVITPANLQELLLPIVQKANPQMTAEDIKDVLDACSK